VTELLDLTVSRSRAPDERSKAISLSGGFSDTEDDDTFNRDSPWSPENKNNICSWFVYMITSIIHELHFGEGGWGRGLSVKGYPPRIRKKWYFFRTMLGLLGVFAKLK